MKKRASFLNKWFHTSGGNEPLNVALTLIRQTRSTRFRSFSEYEQFRVTDIQQCVRDQSLTKSRFRYYCQLNPSLVPHKIYLSGIPDSLSIQYTRLITSSHYLRSETGRWRHLVTPRNDRLCTCGPYVQDENHVLTSCNLTFNIHQKFALTNKTIENIYLTQDY